MNIVLKLRSLKSVKKNPEGTFLRNLRLSQYNIPSVLNEVQVMFFKHFYYFKKKNVRTNVTKTEQSNQNVTLLKRYTAGCVRKILKML